ncbi:MAG: hypothetical protein AB7R90_15860 [Reyranellaceae bacterium]
MTVKLPLLAAVAVAALAAPALAQTQAELDYCNRLAAYYDTYNRRGEGQLMVGGVDRVVGLERCRKGEVKAGTEQLQRAIRLLGFDPPKP